jgi:hypothetical protein
VRPEGLAPFPSDARPRLLPSAFAPAVQLSKSLRTLPPRAGKANRQRGGIHRSLKTGQGERKDGEEIDLGCIPAGCELPRKEVIQPHLPIRLPCYDFTPIIGPTFDGSVPRGFGHRLRVLPTFVV